MWKTERAWAPAAVVSACRSSMRSSYLPTAEPWPGPWLLCSLPPTVSLHWGFPLAGYGQGGQVKWAIPIQGQERRADSPCEMAAHFGRSMHFSFPRALPLSDSQEAKEGGKTSTGREEGEVVFYVCLFVCMSVHAEGWGVLAGHLMVFSMTALSECCWRKMGDALHKLKRHAILRQGVEGGRGKKKGLFPVPPDMRIFSHWTGNFANMNDISDNHIKRLSCAKMNSTSLQWWDSYVRHS